MMSRGRRDAADSPHGGIDMARTNAPGRWIVVAALALGTMLVAAACGGAPSAVVASLPASVAPSVVAATPTAVPSPSPSPVDVAAIFKKTITDPKFSAKADISGTMSVGPIDGTISGKGAFGGRDSSMDLVIDLDVVKQSTSQITVGDKKWTKKDPGPWLLDPNGATPSSSLSVGKILQSLVDVSDLGVVTKNGRSLHHLKVAGADAVSGAMFGLDSSATKDADFSLELYADAAGVPAVMSMSGSWTQVGGDKELPATMAFDLRKVASALTRIIIRTYSAIGRLKTPRALVTTIPRSRAAGVNARSTPEVAEWTHDSRGARVRMRSNASELSQPRSITSTSSTAPSARPSTDRLTMVAPGAAARMRSRSRDR